MRVTRGVAKWLLLLCSIINCLGLASAGLLSHVQTELSKSERSWPQSSAQKSGFDDANPNKATEQLLHAAEHLETIDKMQFYKGHQTSYRRSWPIPQLKCKEGCDSYEPSMVQCTNAKLPDEEVAKWQCEADLPRHLKFQKTTINCEGFESAEDKKILRGSCGLEYSLTKSGLKPIPGRVHRHYYSVKSEERMKGWTASWLVVIAVIMYLIKHNWTQSPVEKNEGLRAKVATAHQAWKSGAAKASIELKKKLHYHSIS